MLAARGLAAETLDPWRGWVAFREAVLRTERELAPDAQVRWVLEKLSAAMNEAHGLLRTNDPAAREKFKAAGL